MDNLYLAYKSGKQYALNVGWGILEIPFDVLHVEPEYFLTAEEVTYIEIKKGIKLIKMEVSHEYFN
jgi:hypothetical protein